jgi:hypothetical protein
VNSENYGGLWRNTHTSMADECPFLPWIVVNKVPSDQLVTAVFDQKTTNLKLAQNQHATNCF